MYFDVSVILVIVLMASNLMDSAPAPSGDLDSEWDELFGHLSIESSVPRVTKPEKFFLGKHGQPKPSGRPLGALPIKPLIFDVNKSPLRPTVAPELSFEPIITGYNKSLKPTIGPAPPSAPFVFDPNSKDKIPSIGANSQGGMEGIAISQNRGISLGLHMVNSTYNNFNTVFGQSNTTQHRIS